MNIYEHIKSNLGLITYPNTLWASHVDGANATIAILHVSALSSSSSTISVDKALTMKAQQHNNNCLQVSTVVNDEKVTLPHAEYNIQTVHDVSNLLFALDNFPPPMCGAPVPNLLNYFPFQSSIEPPLMKPPPPPQPPAPETLTCELCRKVSKSRATHYKHMKMHTTTTTATSDKQFLCTMCGKTFRNSYHLKEHQSVHASSKRFRCDMCNKTFSTSSNLKAHIRTHSGERRHVCNACGKAYTTSSNLQTHIRSIHQDDKPYACDICTMRFVHPRALRLHMLKHTKERPFSCLMCEKSFPKKVHLTVHVRSHTGERPFVCGTCGKGFASNGNLKSHLKMH